MTQINTVIDLTEDRGVAVITVDSPPVNALSSAVRQGLLDAFTEASRSDAKAIVLICAGRTFIAGADIAAFGSAPSEPGLNVVQTAMEDAPKPVVAAIHGTALGGGLEVALAAHYRIAVPSAALGLPEVALGIIPGGGGTQRITRLVGVEAALDLVTSGRHASAAEALKLGLIDALVEEGDLREQAIAFALKMAADKAPLKRVRDSDEKLLPTRGHPEIFTAFRKATARKFRGFLAPEGCIQAIEAAVNLPFVEGLAAERAIFERLVETPQSKAQRYTFFSERAARKVPDVPADTPTLAIRKVGVIGAGTMGAGIAMNFANAGIPVIIVEQAQAPLDRGLATLRKNYERTAARGGITADEVEARVGRITGATDLSALADADLVIEAVFELMSVKKAVFGKLDAICKPGAILASNTSYLDIDEIAAATGRPDHVLGLHFFSPANVMKLLEVVRGEKTAQTVVATAMKLAKTIGKVGVLVGVGPGFVGNRLLAQRQREANRLVLEGALPWDVDRVLVAFGLPMGPFAMADLAGLDLGWVRETSKGETLRDRLCEMDRRGQKTGAGFYDYDAERRASPSPVTEKLIAEFMAERGIEPRTVSDDEILERLIYPMINEGAKILAEGKALRASDIDVVWRNGYGWPPYTGGPMYYADQIGLDKVLAKMQAFQARLGDDFKPAPLLAQLARDGGSFTAAKA